jgi:hypothetical protein
MNTLSDLTNKSQFSNIQWIKQFLIFLPFYFFRVNRHGIVSPQLVDRSRSQLVPDQAAQSPQAFQQGK